MKDDAIVIPCNNGGVNQEQVNLDTSFSLSDKPISYEDAKIESLDSSGVVFLFGLNCITNQLGAINLGYRGIEQITNGLEFVAETGGTQMNVPGSPTRLSGCAFIPKSICDDLRFNGGYINFSVAKSGSNPVYFNNEFSKSEMFLIGNFYRATTTINLHGPFAVGDLVTINEISLYINWINTTILVRRYRVV